MQREVQPRELVGDDGSWETWTPREALRPVFAVDPDTGALMLTGAGNPYAFGGWSRRVPIRAGTTYRLRARLRWQGFDDPNLHVLTIVAWRRGGQRRSNCPQDYLAAYHVEGNAVIAEATLQAPAGTTDAELLLLLRFAPRGTVWWESVTLEAVPALPSRRVTAAVVQGRPPAPAAPETARAYWTAMLQEAAASRPDLVCLPECMNQAGTDRDAQDVAEPLRGPTYQLLAEHARRLGAYVCGCFYEADGDYVFNTAVLLDRRGAFAGRYRKIHPYWPEEPQGVSPGDDLPVFQTELGAIGIMICYDSWFVEPARVLALKGTELLLFPNAGYETKIMPARAIDNRLYIAIASLNSPAAIIDTLGEPLAERRVPGIAAATIDLARRPSPHPNAGGWLNAGPGGLRAARNAASDRLLKELLDEHGRWATEPAADRPATPAVAVPATRYA